MKNRRTGKGVVICVMIVAAWVALGLMTGTRRVSAAAFSVTNTGDNGGVNPAPGAGTGTLRQAIIDANAMAGADTINFAAGVTGTITLGSALPQITQDLTITGPGAGVLMVSGNSFFRVFNIAGGVTVSISGLIISNGEASFGGGILNAGALTVNNSTFSGNSAATGGGICNIVGALTVTNSTFSDNSAGIGGGIFNNSGGTLAVTNSTFSGNSANGEGGGILNLGALTVTNSTFSGNSAGNQGGGIYILNGTLNLKSSIVANNTASQGPDIFGVVSSGDYNLIENTSGISGTLPGSNNITGVDPILGPLADNGGPTQTHALLVGSPAIDAVIDCTDFAANPVTTDQRGQPRPADGDGNGSALCDAGAYEFQPAATFTVMNLNDSGMGSLREAIANANANPGPDTINFQAGLTGTITLTSGHLTIDDPTGQLTINGPGADLMTVSGNNASRVFEVTSGDTVSISGLMISNGAASFGGGILNAGALTVNNSTFSGNSAATGGGICNIVGALTVTNSTFSDNSAGIGGGIFNNSGGTLAVTNSTFSGNSANGEGGGILNLGALTVTNSTFSGNSAGNQGGGIYILNGTLNLKSSIVANNTASQGPDIFGVVSSGDYNLIENTSGISGTLPGSNNITGVDPILGPLADNGGPTQTHALLVGSPAIDAVIDCTDFAANPVTTDQRGQPRPADGDGNGSALCDAGAYEFQPCTVTCPANITQSNDPNQCMAVINYPAPTTVNGDVDCGAVNCTPTSGSVFSVGTTTVTCSTTAGPTCSFTVTVNDTQAPTITCPANITVPTDPNLCSAVVSYTTPTAIDNCTKAMVACSPASGSTFPKGTTTVTCTTTDSSNLTGTCTFTVTVNDTRPPSITCPANVTVPTDPNQCSAVVNYSAPMVSDNCPGVGVPVCSPASGATFPKGTTTVTCTVADASGNTGSCSFTVTVNDTQPPTISCPANVTAVAAQTCPLSTTTAVTFPDPTFSDNCPGATVACVPPSGSIFPAGTTTVTCTATDTSGNTASCSFTVSVFSACLQDDSVPTNVVLFNLTGEYRFCCNGTIFSGTGIATVRGCVVSIQHNPPDRRVLLTFDGALHRGTASLQSPPGTTKCTIIDRDTTNNTCACQGHR